MAGEQEQQRSKQSWIRRLMENPAYLVIAGVATVITIIGLPLSIYFFLAARQVPDLTYYVSPTRTAIVTGRPNQKLSVSYAGQPVNGDISSAQVTIWNAGTKPISHSDLLTPPTLIFPGHNSILDVKLLRFSRTLIGFHEDSSNAAKGILTFDWRILERNDGVTLQIIYVGEPSAKIILAGAIIGQHAPSARSSTQWQTQQGRPVLQILVVTLASAAMLMLGSSLARSLLKAILVGRARFSRFDWVAFSFFAALVMGGMGGALWAVFQVVYANYLNAPPFGF